MTQAKAGDIMAGKNDKTKAAPPQPERGKEDHIGQRIKAARERRGWTQVELSGRSGVDRGVIAGYEKGNYIPGGREIRRLCDALQISPSQLIYGTEIPFPSSVPLELVQNDQALAYGMSLYMLQFFSRSELLAFLGLLQAMYAARRGPDDLRELTVLAGTFAQTMIGHVGWGLGQIESALSNLDHKRALRQVKAMRKRLASGKGARSKRPK